MCNQSKDQLNMTPQIIFDGVFYKISNFIQSHTKYGIKHKTVIWPIYVYVMITRKVEIK